MVLHQDELVIPRSIRLEASTRCQLNCPSCPTANGETAKHLGRGCLSLSNFKKIIDQNLFINSIELSNWGEIFLNKELIEIMRYGYEKKIELSATNGVNLNNVNRDVLEALVKYKFRDISCSIDGASSKVYSTYRRNGNLGRVIENIKTINYFKNLYHSEYPKLKWKFIAFGHNEHEICKARQMATDMQMFFEVKLAWEDLYTVENFSPVVNASLLRSESGLGVASRIEFRNMYGYEYAVRNCCLELWSQPQINFDGRVLGCSINYWNDYGNVFKEGLIKALNSEKISYAREMIMGKKEARDDIPCAQCKWYQKMKKNNDWIKASEVEKFYTQNTPRAVQQAMFRKKMINRMYARLRELKRKLTAARNVFLHYVKDRRLRSSIYPVNIPFAPEKGKAWRPCSVFDGCTSILKSITCHVSSLNKGQCPHPPHIHEEEEILLVLFGEVNLILPDAMADGKEIRLKRGEFVYYPNDFPHTLKTASELPSNYMMFKWKKPLRKQGGSLRYGKYNILEDNFIKTAQGFKTKTMFEGSTDFLKKLHCHASVLAPGSGYEAHCDPYDVVIVVFEGVIETLEKPAGPNSVIFYAAGKLHGMYNPGKHPAKYVVFEFHR